MRAIGRIVLVLCILAAAALTGVGVLRAQDEARFLGKAAKSLGDVTEIQTKPIDEQTNQYCPVVAFTPPSGKPVSFVDAACATVQIQRVGDRVPVLYDPGEPANARIFQAPGSLGAWAVALPFMAWAVLSLLVGAIAVLIFKRL